MPESSKIRSPISVSYKCYSWLLVRSFGKPQDDTEKYFVPKGFLSETRLCVILSGSEESHKAVLLIILLSPQEAE